MKKIMNKLNKAWDKIEELMEVIEKKGKSWILKHEFRIYNVFFIITFAVMYLAYQQRGYGAVGGEVLIPLIPFAIINYLKWSE